jgi:hypothetical protein
MAFRENLLKKIEIDRLADKVLATIGPAGGEIRLDKQSMRALLGHGPYTHRRERDLDLWVEDTAAEVRRIIVLDNELPIYRTTIADVAMRKSPEVGEMVKIGNIVKILRDSDVKISRKADSVKAVQADCIERLDLRFTPADIDDMRRDGIASLQSNYAEGLEEGLALFAALLGWGPAPGAFQTPHTIVLGATHRKPSGEEVFGPAVAFSRVHNRLALTEERYGSLEKERLAGFHRIASGQEGADVEGAAVFERLQEMVLTSRSMGS